MSNIDNIFYEIKKIEEDGFKNFDYRKSILTKNDKELKCENGFIIISPVDNSIGISIRGLDQYSGYINKLVVEKVKNNFSFFVSNRSDEYNKEAYKEFIDVRLSELGNYQPHLMCLYTENLKEEFNNRDKIIISVYDNETNKSNNVYTSFYPDFRSFFFKSSILIKKGDYLAIGAKRGKDELDIDDYELYLECDRWYKK